MLSLRWKFGALLALLLTASAWGQTYNCLPTCDSTDARFLAISGSNLVNLSNNKLDLTLSVPATTTTFRLGVFDGDANGTDGAGVSHWDTSGAATYQYTLYADPTANGSGTTVIQMVPGSPAVLSTSMPDNAWIDFTINTTANAKAPSGNYFYRLTIELMTPALTTTNAFKVRTDAIVSGTTINPIAQPFSYIANMRGLADIQIVHPSYPSEVPTRMTVLSTFTSTSPSASATSRSGTATSIAADSMASRIRTPMIPTPRPCPCRPGQPSDALPEGVAIGTGGTTGNPSDDRSPAGAGIYSSRPPSVQYSVVFPDGQSFPNPNPSGNSEWEQFKISTDPFDRSVMDYHADIIPPGIYKFRGIGVDMQNLNALLLPSRILCVSQAGDPCRPLRPYLIGDTVFADDNEQRRPGSRRARHRGRRDGAPGRATEC